jgi:hypothetical protein
MLFCTITSAHRKERIKSAGLGLRRIEYPSFNEAGPGELVITQTSFPAQENPLANMRATVSYPPTEGKNELATNAIRIYDASNEDIAAVRESYASFGKKTKLFT